MNLGRILVTGGAGYIGSHVVHTLKAHGAHVMVLDNLSTGFSDSIPDITLFKGNTQDNAFVDQLFASEKIDAVMHLAACTVISESIENPFKYYENNTMGTLNLLKACTQYGVKYFIFSSTAAVYGPLNQDLNEQSRLLPTNPYGRSKLMSEQMIQDFDLNYVNLRYFNVAGADPHANIGQRSPNASHLIKVAVETACHKRSSLPIYGDDYPTPDGTCIRDFIHVSDVADAHLHALQYLKNGGNSITLNCGYGQGFSVKEVIQAIEDVTQQSLPYFVTHKRKGDLPRVVADNQLIQQKLNWQPQFNDLKFIVKTALAFEKKN